MKGVKVQALVDEYDQDTGRLQLTVASYDRVPCELGVMRLRGKQVVVGISRWYKARTTGEHSQNHRFNGFVRQYCEESGNDFDDIKLYVKRKAMRRGLGPMLNDKGEIVFSKVDGEPLPKSEAEMDTVECSWCIEEIQQLAAEYPMILVESENE